MNDPYQQELEEILSTGVIEGDRTGKGTIAPLHSPRRIFDLRERFPITSLRKVYMDAAAKELGWMLSGSTDVRDLIRNDANFWTPDAFRVYRNSVHYEDETVEQFSERLMTEEEFGEAWGDLGPIYGRQWRDANGVDQITEALSILANNPNSRRVLVNSWNASDLEDMALHPCPHQFQLRARDGTLNLTLSQRSQDMMPGAVFNDAFYGLLTHLFAEALDLEPGFYTHNDGDGHVYLDHIPMAEELLRREPIGDPQLTLHDDARAFLEETLQHPYMTEAERGFDPVAAITEIFTLEGYEHHGRMWVPLHVGIDDQKMPDHGKRAGYYEELQQTRPDLHAAITGEAPEHVVVHLPNGPRRVAITNSEPELLIKLPYEG